ncbi:MAG TPA: aldehyde dehydrogenase [Bacillota bacterium]|nr:aldehyde dehydrogenase [Bacillota bacterium]
MELQTLVNKQKKFFLTKQTLNATFRKKQLKTLKKMLKTYEERIYQALKKDLNKSKHETLTTELGVVYAEIDFALKHLNEWMSPEKVPAPITHKGTENIIYKEPYGSVLIISAWNYPLQLSIAPAIGAIAAGNCIVLKPSEHAAATSSLLAEMIQATFDEAYFTVVEGEKDVSQRLTELPFDYIFFTGNAHVGKAVMAQASKHLTPVTLELGGKSPAVIDKHAKINLAAKRIAWGKFTNAGQTCVAPDYVYVHEKVKTKFVKTLKKYIIAFYGKKPLQNKDYVKIINTHHFDRLHRFLTDGMIVHGGKSDRDKCMIEPTVLDNVSWQDDVMQEEIFGPILPVLSFRKLNDVITKLKQGEKPLAFYYFGKDERTQEQILEELSFGGGCINDTLYHLANPHLPFGGVGSSGMGAYHGKYGFHTFSHNKSVMKQTTAFDIPLRYPGSRIGHSLVKKIMG